ncbi:M23 family metallopeptidase [Colwellia sp. MB02u-14]|uniref:M23 family metallopeptidase n=1 Tax=Colwellia sp. MB02u-14 TaxID=2759815 RepID=UPI0015F48785|nr:M23 family metallopeptidase [Colwellia sp. MB02u-14]MBA6304857.1 M23 family metallopeptidase [Colwellia sp. MB02u-14]
MKKFRLIVLCLPVVLLAFSTLSGMLMNYLFVFLLLSAITMIVTFIVSLVKKQVDWGFSYREQGSGIYLRQGFLRNATWIIIGYCIYTAVIPIQFSSTDFTVITVMIWGSVVTLCLLDWMPRKQIGKSLNVTLSIFLIFLIYQLAIIYFPVKSTDSIVLIPPFKGDWYVLHGGNSPLINHHHFVGSQKYAMDILAPEDGKLPFEQITDLQKYKTFGKSLFSPVDGVIVSIENSLPDQKIGETDRQNIAGNHVVIKTETDIFILMAHLQYNSLLVAEGDSVKIGQEIAKIGNSGNTSQPHLHIQAMTAINFMDPKTKPVPISFKISKQKPVFYKRNDIF